MGRGWPLIERGDAIPMIQTVAAPRPRPRVPMLAAIVVAFALGMLAATTLPHPNAVGVADSRGAASRGEVGGLTQTTLSVTQLDRGTCGQGAYVTGDMVGDASPASV